MTETQDLGEARIGRHGQKYWTKPADFEPTPHFPEESRWYGKLRCKAWASNAGRQCLSPATKDKDVCARHGGKAPSGVDSPKYKPGNPIQVRPQSAYSKAVRGTRYDDLYHMAATQESLSLMPDIAFNQARISDTIERLNKIIEPDQVAAMREILANIKKAMSENNLLGLAQGINAIDKLLDKIEEGAGASKTLNALVSQRVKLTATENRHVKDQHHMMAVSTVLAILNKTFNEICLAVESNVDEHVAQVIFTETHMALEKTILSLTKSLEIEEGVIFHEDV